MLRAADVKTAALLLVLAMGCTGGTEPPTSGPARVRIGYAPIADCAHLYVATEQKLWAAHGLAVEETQLAAGPKILEALAAGSVDVGFTGMVTLIQARAGGLPFVAVGGAIVEDTERTAHRLIVAQDSAITGVQDLAGKSVALATLRGIDQLVLMESLEKAGVPTDSVQLREVPFPRMEGVLQSGEVDAALAMEPYVSAAAKNGTARSVGDPYTDVAARTLVSTWVMKEDAAAGAVGDAVASTLADAAQWMATHDAETRAIVARRTNLDPAIVAEMPMNRMEPEPLLADVQAMIDRTAKAGLVTSPPAASALLAP
jgi:NitT/TauT family transport system substrate-binding protein